MGHDSRAIQPQGSWCFRRVRHDGRDDPGHSTRTEVSGLGASVGEVEFWVHDPGDFEATVEGLVEDQTYYYRTFATNDGGSDWASDTMVFTSADRASYDSGKLTINTSLGTWSHSDGDYREGSIERKIFTDVLGNQFEYSVCTFTFDSVDLRGNLEVEVIGDASWKLSLRMAMPS